MGIGILINEWTSLKIKGINRESISIKWRIKKIKLLRVIKYIFEFRTEKIIFCID